MKITKEMTIIQITKKYPQTAKVLKKFNMACIGCMGAEAETVAQGAVMHGLDVNLVLKELNASLATK